MMTGSSHSSEDVEQAQPLLPPEAAEVAAPAEAAEVAAPAEAARLKEVVVATGDAAAPAEAARLKEVVVATGDAEEEDEIRPGRANYGATEIKSATATEEEAANGGKKGKEGKGKKAGKTALEIGQKAVADALKTDMAAERTFFKWLWTGLHTGAIGSFIFIAFDGDKQDPMRIVVVGFSWLVALCLVLYGTFAYYRRRHALRTGNIRVIPEFTREHSPLLVVLSLALVVGVALAYASQSGFKPSKDGIAGATSALGGA